jgi:hypothetical protein
MILITEAEAMMLAEYKAEYAWAINRAAEMIWYSMLAEGKPDLVVVQINLRYPE